MYFQVLGEQAKSEDVYDDSKFYVLRAEWFWTRIAEGYAPEDDFLFKDVSLMVFLFENFSNFHEPLNNFSLPTVHEKHQRRTF